MGQLALLTIHRASARIPKPSAVCFERMQRHPVLLLKDALAATLPPY